MEPVRILLAEDNVSHRWLLLTALVNAHPHVDVVFAGTREAVIEAVASRSFDCILLDFNLHGATAAEVLMDIAQVQPDVPRIVISSSEDQHVVIEALRRGVSDFVPKQAALGGAVLWEHVRRAMERASRECTERRSIDSRLRHLEQQAITDPLTGLPNRRAVEGALASPERSDRRLSLGVAFLDLDRFKSINDRFGHAVGDATLRRVAETIRAHACEPDLCCRWGGEEFVVVRETSSLPELWAWADGLRASIERHGAEGLPVESVTVSIGVDIVRRGMFPPSGVCGADQAMYTAKSLGRNRVCTPAMARAHRLATRLAEHSSMAPKEQLVRLLAELRPALGKTQIQHVWAHGRAVQRLAARLAGELSLSREATECVEFAAEFHDIGKVGLPEEVLAAPRRLSRSEQHFVNEHAPFGADLLAICGARPSAVEAVRGHHRRHSERSSQVIESHGQSLSSILCVCDAYATMLEERPYACARPKAEAIAELLSHRGSQFDPCVVDVLCGMEGAADRAA